MINRSAYGNMACLFTSSGAAARQFRYEARVGNVGINVGVAAPMAYFPFSGWKDSFFGDLHAQGRDAIDFYTEKKIVVERWPRPGGENSDRRGGSLGPPDAVSNSRRGQVDQHRPRDRAGRGDRDSGPACTYAISAKRLLPSNCHLRCSLDGAGRRRAREPATTSSTRQFHLTNGRSCSSATTGWHALASWLRGVRGDRGSSHCLRPTGARLPAWKQTGNVVVASSPTGG